MLIIINKNQKGISIIEVLVCLSIVSLALVGILTMVTQSMQVQYINKNNLIASQLAQECQEMVRSQRDNNWLSDPVKDFYEGVADATGAIKDYAISVDGSGLYETTQSGGADDYTDIYLCHGGPYDKFYMHNIPSKGCADVGGSSESLTVFKRTATTEYHVASSSISVDCNVHWSERGRSYNYRTSAILFQWDY